LTGLALVGAPSGHPFDERDEMAITLPEQP
jgi:hypothetical protein